LSSLGEKINSSNAPPKLYKNNHIHQGKQLQMFFNFQVLSKLDKKRAEEGSITMMHTLPLLEWNLRE